MAALSLSWCHTFAFGGILVVACASLLVTVGAADTNSLETAVRDAAMEYLAHYEAILTLAIFRSWFHSRVISHRSGQYVNYELVTYYSILMT